MFVVVTKWLEHDPVRDTDHKTWRPTNRHRWRNVKWHYISKKKENDVLETINGTIDGEYFSVNAFEIKRKSSELALEEAGIGEVLMISRHGDRFVTGKFGL